jgi:hypothetical protein
MSENINTMADPAIDELAMEVSGGNLSDIELDSESQIIYMESFYETDTGHRRVRISGVAFVRSLAERR